MPYSRARAVETVQGWLVRRSLPRVQMFVMIALTGLAGFGVSFCLLHAGLWHMSIRYPVSILVAYGVFLGLLRVWLWLCNPERTMPRIDAGLDDLDGTDVGNVGVPNVRIGSSGSSRFRFGGKGDYGGGGASDSWSGKGDGARAMQNQTLLGGMSANRGGSSSGGGGGSFGGIDLDDDGVWIVIAVVAVLAVVIACGYVIWVAPALFAEILFDGLLVTRLYRRMRDVETRYWLWTAVRKTVGAVVVVMLFAGVAGYALEKITPGARSIGDVWRGAPEPPESEWPGAR